MTFFILMSVGFLSEQRQKFRFLWLKFFRYFFLYFHLSCFFLLHSQFMRFKFFFLFYVSLIFLKKKRKYFQITLPWGVRRRRVKKIVEALGLKFYTFFSHTLRGVHTTFVVDGTNSARFQIVIQWKARVGSNFNKICLNIWAFFSISISLTHSLSLTLDK